MNILQSALSFSHTLLSNAVKPGDRVIDATMGNGHDTLFLAQLVGDSGHVDAFDIQKQALTSTNGLLEKNQIAKNTYTLHQASHDTIAKTVPASEPISAAIFNLGYLPGGDKTVITHKDSSLNAIKQCLDLLSPHGLVIVVLYYGHEGGVEEKNAILQFASQLDQHQFNVMTYQFINQVQAPPICLAFEKRN